MRGGGGEGGGAGSIEKDKQRWRYISGILKSKEDDKCCIHLIHRI